MVDTLRGLCGMARRHKRLWTAEEKRSICQQTRAPGVSVAQVARRYAVNANLIFKWLRDARFAPGDEAPVEAPAPSMDVGSHPGAAVFLPVELAADVDSDGSGSTASVEGTSSPPEGVICIELAGGHRLRVEGAYDPDALVRLLRGLAGAAG